MNKIELDESNCVSEVHIHHIFSREAKLLGIYSDAGVGLRFLNDLDDYKTGKIKSSTILMSVTWESIVTWATNQICCACLCTE